MKLRSGKITRVVEVRKRNIERKRKSIKKNRRQITGKPVNTAEIRKIVDKSSRLVVKINRMSSKNNLNEQVNRPHGESSSAVSQNSDTTNTTNTGAHGHTQTIDSETVAEALQVPLPQFDELSEEEGEQQNQQQQNAQPANTRKKKMTEILVRPAKLRIDANVRC